MNTVNSHINIAIEALNNPTTTDTSFEEQKDRIEAQIQNIEGLVEVLRPNLGDTARKDPKVPLVQPEIIDLLTTGSATEIHQPLQETKEKARLLYQREYGTQPELKTKLELDNDKDGKVAIAETSTTALTTDANQVRFTSLNTRPTVKAEFANRDATPYTQEAITDITNIAHLTLETMNKEIDDMIAKLATLRADPGKVISQVRDKAANDGILKGRSEGVLSTAAVMGTSSYFGNSVAMTAGLIVATVTTGSLFPKTTTAALTVTGFTGMGYEAAKHFGAHLGVSPEMGAIAGGVVGAGIAAYNSPEIKEGAIQVKNALVNTGTYLRSLLPALPALAGSTTEKILMGSMAINALSLSLNAYQILKK